jgi:glycosyltransferase involved in cell wall biosynthesis
VHVLQMMLSEGWGGLEIAFVDLCSELATRCRLTVVAPEGSETLRRLPDGVGRVLPAPGGSRRNPITVLRVRRTVTQAGPHLVHTHAEKATEVFWWANRFSPFVHVATKHNTRCRRVFDHVPFATAVSPAVARTIRNRRGVTVIPNGIRVREVAPGPEPEVFTMTAVGRLNPLKGFDRLVRAAAELTFPFRLRIAGEGPQRQELERLVADLGLGERVTLLGHREDVPEVIAGSHLLVIPSLSEGFGLTLLEGLAYADLVLATDVGVAPDLLPERFLLDGENIAGGLRAAHAQYGELVAAFQDVKARHAGRFTWAAVADAYVETYRSALAERGR